jgi:signal transduction histidine kinase
LQQQLEAQSEQSSDVELMFWKNEIQELARDREVLVKERNRLAEELADAKAKLEDLTEDYTILKRSLEEQESGNGTAGKGTGIAVGLLVTDEDGDITMADALARQMLRLPSGDITNISADEVYPDPKWTATVKELLSTKANARRRAHLTLDATGTTLEMDLATLVGRDAKPDGLAITLHTEESSVEKYAAIASIADEFRTPITAVTGYTDLLLSEQAGILTEMQQQFLERVKANVEQMGYLFNDLLTFTAPNNHPIKFELQPLDVIDVLKEAIRGLSARFQERHLKVRLKVPRDGLEPVRANYDILYQIVLRLISNAALCSQEGTEILIRARQETLADINRPANINQLKDKEKEEPIQYIHISVTDTGGGIAQEDLSRVFRHIYRARQPLIQGMGETGIGMAVAKTLVETVGGGIWVESEAGKGSTFSFILPVDTNDK